MTQSPWTHQRDASVADDIDFEIKGQELQFLEIELDAGESAVAEAGALVWKDASIGMTTVFGDGSGDGGGGFMGKLPDVAFIAMVLVAHWALGHFKSICI